MGRRIDNVVMATDHERQGSQAALEHLKKRFGPGYILLLECMNKYVTLGPDMPPEEYAQEALLIWRRLRHIRTEGQLRAWSIRVWQKAIGPTEKPIDWSFVSEFARDFWAQWQAFQVTAQRPTSGSGGDKTIADAPGISAPSESETDVQ